MLVKVFKKENLKHREVVIYTSDGDCRINDFVDYIYHFEKQIIGYQRGE